MSQGTLYGDVQTRCILPVGLVKAFNLDVKLASKDASEFAAAFPSGKVPAFAGPKGYKLQESIAVLYYCTYYPFALLTQERTLRDLHDEKNF